MASTAYKRTDSRVIFIISFSFPENGADVFWILLLYRWEMPPSTYKRLQFGYRIGYKGYKFGYKGYKKLQNREITFRIDLYRFFWYTTKKVSCLNRREMI